MKKAERVIAKAEGTTPPWQWETEDAGDLYTLTLTRGEENMQIVWDTSKNDALVHPLTYSLSGVRETRLRNVSAALKLVEGSPDYTGRKAKKTVSKPRPTEADEKDWEPVAIPLPFDPLESTDRDIVKSIVGKRIVWRNTMNGEYETAVVPPRERVEIKDADNPGKMKWVLRTSRNITIKTTSAGRRVLTFPAVNEQFRSVALDQIVQIN